MRKHNLKAVIAAIANAGSSTLGGCGDINRNTMAPPAPFTNDPAYQHVFDTTNVIAELFRPSSPSFAELWLDGEKTATVEYWKKDLLYGATAKPGTTSPIPGRPQDIATLEEQLEVRSPPQPPPPFPPCERACSPGLGPLAVDAIACGGEGRASCFGAEENRGKSRASLWPNFGFRK